MFSKFRNAAAPDKSYELADSGYCDLTYEKLDSDKNDWFIEN